MMSTPSFFINNDEWRERIKSSSLQLINKMPLWNTIITTITIIMPLRRSR